MAKQQAGNERRAKRAAKTWAGRKAEIEFLCHRQEWSQAKVAEYFGVSQTGIQKVMARLGITPRARANYGKRNGRYKDGSQSRLYRQLVDKERCACCGATDTLGIHHKNNDHYDNRLSNLEVLCNSCHLSKTKRLWWKAKKAGLSLPKSNGPIGWSS